MAEALDQLVGELVALDRRGPRHSRSRASAATLAITTGMASEPSHLQTGQSSIIAQIVSCAAPLRRPRLMRRLPASAPATHDGCGARLQKALDKSVKSGKPTTGDVKILLKLVETTSCWSLTTRRPSPFPFHEASPTPPSPPYVASSDQPCSSLHVRTFLPAGNRTVYRYPGLTGSL